MPDYGVHLSRHLEQTLPGVIRQRFRPFRYENGMLVPTIADLSPGAQVLVQEQIEGRGQAAVVADQAFDIPLADYNVSETRDPVVAVFSSFHYTVRELQAATFANQPLTDERQRVARRAIASRINELTAFGSAQYGLTGMLNNPLTPVDDTSFDPYASATTAEDLVDFFVEKVAAVTDSTDETEYPNHIEMAFRLWKQLSSKRLSGTAVSAIEHLRKLFSGEESGFSRMTFGTSPELKSEKLERYGVHSAGTNKDRIAVYPRSAEILDRHIESTQVLETEYRNAQYIVPMYSCISGVRWKYPLAGRYVDVAKPA